MDADGAGSDALVGEEIRAVRPLIQVRRMAGRAELDRAPYQALAQADEEPDRVRAGHRLAVLHHRHQHPLIGGIGGVPGSHHAQCINVLHRVHTVVEDQARTNKAMGLRNLPSKTLGGELRVGTGREHRRRPNPPGAVPSASTTAATSRTPSRTRCARLWAPPARLVRHARARVMELSRAWPWKEAFLACWQQLCALPAPPDQLPRPCDPGKEPVPVWSEPVPAPGTSGSAATRREPANQTLWSGAGTTRSVTSPVDP